MKRVLVFIGYIVGSILKTKLSVLERMWNLLVSGYLSSDLKGFNSSLRIGKGTRFKGAEFFVFGKNVYISDNCVIEARTILQDEPLLHFGDNVLIGSNAHISCINSITIGDNLLTGKNITIVDNSHGLTDKISLKERPINRKMTSKGSVVIGDNVWIGDKVTILPNVRIGRGCVIGANVVVSEDLDDFTILVSASNRKYVKH